MTAFDPHADLAFTTVAIAGAPSPATSGTALTVVDATRFPDPAVSGPYNVTVNPAGATRAQIVSGAEIARVTAKAGNVLTIARAAEGPNAARAIVDGDEVSVTATAKVFTDIEAALNSRAAGLTVLYDVTLGVDAASIDTGAGAIPAGYGAIEIWVIARTADAGANADLAMTLNGDTGGNYDFEFMSENAATFGGGSLLAQTSWKTTIHGSGGSAAYPGLWTLVIPGYDKTTFNKVASMTTHVPDATAGNSDVGFLTAGWRSTAAITQVKIAGATANLKAGSRLVILGVSAPASVAAAASGEVELDYVEKNSTVTVAATTAAGADHVVDGAAITFDGSTKCRIEFFTPLARVDSGQALVFELYDGSTDLGVIAQLGDTGNPELAEPVPGERVFTPSAGSHTFSIRAWKTGGTALVQGGAGGGGVRFPAYYRVTKIAASGGAGGATTYSINQTAHGFVVGNVLRLNGTTYVKAQADNAADAEVAGIVSSVVDVNNFVLLVAGKVTGLSGLTAGTAYFLDPTTAGALAAVEPTTVGQISKPVLVADSTTSGYFFNFRGEVIGGSTAPGALLAVVAFSPGGAITTTSATLVDLDAANLAITFQAPASGKVLLRVTTPINTGAVVNSFLGFREGAAIVAGPKFAGDTQTAGIDQLVTTAFYVTGIAAGAHTYKLAGAINSGQTLSLRAGNEIVMEVWSCPS